MFTVELLRRLPRDSGVQCFVVHPGEATTAITRTLPGPLYRLYQRVLPRLLLTTEQGARCRLWVHHAQHYPEAGLGLKQRVGWSPCSVAMVYPEHNFDLTHDPTEL